MTVAAPTAPAPGWYPDPHSATDLRWWDGAGWTDFTSAVPQPDPEPWPEPELSFLATIAELETDPEPIEFLHVDPDPEPSDVDFPASQPRESATTPVAAGEPEPFHLELTHVQPVVPPEPTASIEVEPVDSGSFVFQARPLPEPEPEVAAVAVDAEPPRLVYASPLPVIKSPVAAKIVVPVPQVEVAVEPEPVALVEEPVPLAPLAPRRSRRPAKRAVVGTAAVVVAAAGAAGATNVLRGGDSPTPAGAAALKSVPVAAAAADKSCLKEWNTAASGDAAQTRVTLGQFSGAFARVSRVKPLPGTLMDPDSCALTVYDPATDAHAVFVAGVKDQIGYLDVTAYPRAARYGWPETEKQANVAILDDGSIAARS